MPLRTDAYYRELAEEWVRKSGVIEPPVPVEAIAVHVGVPVREALLPIWFEGMLIYEDGMPVIMVNAALADRRRRTTVGHLLAHLLIVLDDPEAGYPRETSSDHRQPDVMAAEFVTPSTLVRDQAKKWFNDFRYLAGLFGVSEDEMVAKMTDLRLLRRAEQMWDF